MSQSIFEPQYEVLNFNFHEASISTIIFDEIGQLKHINKTFSNFLMLKNPEELIGASLFKGFQIDQAYINQLNETTTPLSFELLFDISRFGNDNNILGLSSEQIPVKYTITYTKNHDYVLRIEKVFTLKEISEAVLKKNEQLSSALSAGNVCLWDWNLKDNTVFFSENFYQWFDFDVHYIEKNANSFFDLIHPSDILSLQTEMNRYIANPTSEFIPEFRMRQNEVDYIWIRSAGTVINDPSNKPVRFTGININITSQKQSNMELEEKKDALSNLFDNMNTGFALHRVITNEQNEPIDYEFHFLNPAFERLTGLNRNLLLGKRVLEIMPSLDIDWIKRLGHVALSGKTAHFTKYSSELKKHFDIIAYQSEPEHFAVIFSDVTEKIRAESALAQADKMNSVGQLAGGIAHDFNNHLQIIKGYSEILESNLKAKGEMCLLDYVEKIQYSVTHSSKLIKQLLAFSKDGTFNEKPMDFHLLLHQTKNILSYTINKNIHIQLLLDAKDYLMIGDESLLQNAIINLCLNSRDALPKGGIIQIMTRNITFHKETIVGLSTITEGKYIQCSIRDNGEGILPDDITRIFEPFFTTKPNKGTGMGLAATYNSIKNHGGSIDVSSHYGEWTQFDLYLPTSTESVRYEQYIRKPLLDSFKPYHILLVDDEPVIALVIKQYLVDLGYEVTVYNSPNEVLSNFNHFSKAIDIAILDVIMPEMNGFDLLSELIQLDPNLKAIFLSGYLNTDTISPLLKTHILDYIEKPVKLTELNDKIQRLLLNSDDDLL